MTAEREQLWIAMSDLWLDTELSDDRLAEIAAVVRDAGLDEAELDEVFAFELAPFLDANLRQVAGEWGGFDPEQVCAEARARQGSRRLQDRAAARLGIMGGAARQSWARVKALAAGGTDRRPPE